MQWLKHAFAVAPPEAAEPTAGQKAAAEKFCREIVRRHLTTPALIGLESLRPLNYLIAQGMHVAMPFVSALVNARPSQEFATFLEQRGSVDYLCRRIEQLESEATAHETRAVESNAGTTPADAPQPRSADHAD